MRRVGLVISVVAWLARMIYRVFGWRRTVSGAEHLPTSGPVVVAANHVSHLDPLHLGVAVVGRRRHVAFLAKRELFESPKVGWLLRLMQQVEVDRGGDAARSLGPAVDHLREGWAVVIFPEGTISTSYVPAPPRLGAARLALEAGAPIVPAAVWGGQRVLTKGRRDLRRRGVLMTVRFGEPIHPLPDEDARQLTARVWEAVGALVDQEARAYPQRPTGPEDRWWLPAHLGGTAPSVQEALARRTAEDHARRARRQSESP